MINWRDCIVPIKHTYKRNDLYVWVAYDKNPPYLPIAIAQTTEELGVAVNVNPATIRSVWSKYQRGIIESSNYHHVKVGLD